jgi:hypothetical protein
VFFIVPFSLAVAVFQQIGLVWISWWSSDALRLSLQQYIVVYCLFGLGTSIVSTVRQVMVIASPKWVVFAGGMLM